MTDHFVDVSFYQSGVNWSQVKGAGYIASYIKASGAQIQTGVYVDRLYHKHVQDVRAAGMGVGHYFFNGDALSPTGCADYFVANLEYHAGDRVGLDIENDGRQAPWSPSKALEFAGRVKQKLGIVPDIYLNWSGVNGSNWQSLKDAGCRLWFAYPGPTPTNLRYWGKPDFHQYSIAAVPGAGSIDVNKTIDPAVWAAAVKASEEVENDMSVSLVKDAQSATIFACNANTGKRVGVTSVYHCNLITRFLKGDPGMLVVEMDIVQSYLSVIGAVTLQPNQVTTATVDPKVLETALANVPAVQRFPSLDDIATAAGKGARAAIVADPSPIN